MTNAQHRAGDDRAAPQLHVDEHAVSSGVARRAPAAGSEPATDAVGRHAQTDAELDCAPMMIVRLDAGGRVNHVNEAWRHFVRKSGGAPLPSTDGLGQPYLELVRAVNEPAARAVARVLQQLPAAPGAAVSDEYRCYVEDALHWFRIEARRLADGLLLMHTDISEQRRAEAHLLIQTLVSTALAGRQPLVSACRRIIVMTCESLAWDFAAVWVPNDWQQLVCSDVWVNPRLAGSEFENLTRATAFERGKGLPGRVWETQRPLWIHDLAAADVFPRLKRARAIGLQSGFAVPPPV
jgi:hypothetical protein